MFWSDPFYDQNTIGAVEVKAGPRKWKRGFLARAYIRRCVEQYVVRYYLFRRLKALLNAHREIQTNAMPLLTRKLYGAGSYGVEALLYTTYLTCTRKQELAQQALGYRVIKAAT